MVYLIQNSEGQLYVDACSDPGIRVRWHNEYGVTNATDHANDWALIHEWARDFETCKRHIVWVNNHFGTQLFEAGDVDPYDLQPPESVPAKNTSMEESIESRETSNDSAEENQAAPWLLNWPESTPKVPNKSGTPPTNQSNRKSPPTLSSLQPPGSVPVKKTNTEEPIDPTRTQEPENRGARAALHPAFTAKSDLLDALKKIRREIAREKGIDSYVIFDNKTLKAMSELHPRTHSEMLGVPGIARLKLKWYADYFLPTLVDWPEEASKAKPSMEQYLMATAKLNKTEQRIVDYSQSINALDASLAGINPETGERLCEEDIAHTEIFREALLESLFSLYQYRKKDLKKLNAPSKAGQLWQPKEIADLKEYVAEGMARNDIAEIMGRTPHAIKMQCLHAGINPPD